MNYGNNFSLKSRNREIFLNFVTFEAVIKIFAPNFLDENK